ncbi:MAG: hypothetical protein AB1782_01050 [Cyanobacteriota bacterium]
MHSISEYLQNNNFEKSFQKDIICFGNQNKNVPLPATNKSNYIINFMGLKVHNKDVENYIELFKDYTNLSDMHNRLLGSYADPSTMAQALNDYLGKRKITKNELMSEVIDNLSNTFERLKAVQVIMVENSKKSGLQIISNGRYEQVRNIYHDLLQRPETFNRYVFNEDKQLLETNSLPELLDKQINDFKHIINAILPKVINSKTLLTDDPSNLQRLLSDDVVRGLVLDELDKENNQNQKPKENNEIDYNLTPSELTLESAIKVLEIINKKFDITLMARTAKKFYSPFSSNERVPENYYQNKMLGTRQEPKNFYEAEFLKQTLKDSKGINSKNIIIVTPKNAASDIVEKVKSMNKGYLFIEDWFYKYCLGDNNEREKIITDLIKASNNNQAEEIRSRANDLNNYLENFIRIYDIKKPENNDKLNTAMKDFSKQICMSEISKGYFLEVGKDATDFIKLFAGLYAFGEGFQKIARNFDGGSMAIIGETAVSLSKDVSEACQNYLKWKQEFGDEEAKELFEKTISHIISAGGPTLALDLAAYGTPLRNIVMRNASCVSMYAEVIGTFKKYYAKLEDLIQKGLKKVPDEYKQDPDKATRWKLTETWKAFAAHSLNRGEFMGILFSQPFAIAAPFLCGASYPVGAGTLFVLFDQTLEAWISNTYLVLDSSKWHRFKNKLKKKFLNNKKANLTAQEYIELRKTISTRFIESDIGQSGLKATVNGIKLIPKRLTSGIKKGYSKIFNLVSKSIGKVVSKVCIKHLDKKYIERLNQKIQNDPKAIKVVSE